ncbi:MAG: AMP-binding protein, partial [Alphaproteobacteria bacterium]|nr:AMP-binding protein [Alphaproteobacteria bacterium]
MAPADAPTVFYALPELHYPDRLNAVETLLEGAITRGWGPRTAYLHRGLAISYETLRREVHRTAAALRRAGIVAGDRVLLRLEDGPELVHAILAVQAIGACAVPTYVQLRADGLTARANDSGAVAAIVSASLMDAFAGVPAQCPGLAHTIIVPARGVVPDAGSAPHHSLDRLRPNALAEFAYAATHQDDVALILYTLGSTGQPKGTLHSHADLLAICDTYARHCVGLRVDDVIAGPAALPFALGIGFFIYFPLRFGAAAVLDDDKSPETLVDALACTGATILVGVSTYYNRLGRIIAERKLSFPALRMALCGGEPLPADIDRAWREATGLVLEQFLGTTELLHIVLGIRHGVDQPRPGAIGRPVPGYEVSIRHPETFAPVPVGEPGLLAVRGATGTSYLNRPHDQRATVRQGWNVFQDIVRADPDGFIHYLSRHDDMIVSGGHSISPVEVEQILHAHPAILECACVPARDRRGERPAVVMAFVVLAPAVPRSERTKRELQDYFKRSGPPYMYPRDI